MIYFDNSSTTTPLKEVCDSMDYSMRNYWGNPSSLHKLGIEAEKDMKSSKKVLALAIGCEPGEIVFTSCGSEAINMILKGFWQSYPRNGKHIITSAGEHLATLETVKYLMTLGIKVDFLPLDEFGNIKFAELENLVTPQTSLISLIDVNNETGAKLDVDSLIKLRNRYCPAALIHLDCVQSFCKSKIRIAQTGVDYISISAHKINGPKGIGALYHKKTAKVFPLIHGGGQQNSLRSGTENIALIKAMAIAAKAAYKDVVESFDKVSSIKNTLLEEFSKNDIEYVLNSPKDGSPYILNVSFPGIKAETLLHTFEISGLYVSTVSACSSKKQKISHVLEAMGVDEKIARSAIRFSFSRFNTQEEAVLAAKIVKDALLLLSPK